MGGYGDTGDDDVVDDDHHIHYSHYNHDVLCGVILLLYGNPVVFHVYHVHCSPSQEGVQHHPLYTCDLLVSVIQSESMLQVVSQSQPR